MNTLACSVDGCEKTAYARRWCRRHYSRWQRHGDPMAMLRGENPESCTADDCGRKPHAKGLCRPHYKRFRRNGDLNYRLKHHSTPEESFADNTRRSGACLEWTGYLNPAGYGQMGYQGQRSAHRYAWERVNGPIPDGMYIDHMCHNRACVNVNHLRVVTHAQNMQNHAGARVDSKSGVRGVYWNEKGGGWMANASVNGKRHIVGRFDDIKEAERAAIAIRKDVMPWSIK